MKQFCSLFLVLLLAVFAAGCAASVSGNKVLGQETAASLDQFFVKGKTTQDEVIAKFGQPEGNSLFDGKQVWTYNYYKGISSSPGRLLGYVPVPGVGQAMGAVPRTNDSTGKQLTVTFSKKGVVEKFDFTELNDSTVHTGI